LPDLEIWIELERAICRKQDLSIRFLHHYKILLSEQTLLALIAERPNRGRPCLIAIPTLGPVRATGVAAVHWIMAICDL
jgi:hypothetical protein